MTKVTYIIQGQGDKRLILILPPFSLQIFLFIHLLQGLQNCQPHLNSTLSFFKFSSIQAHLFQFLHVFNMVIGGALRATGCASCRLTLLRRFTSVAGISIQPRSLSQQLYPPIFQSKAQHTTRTPQEESEGEQNKDQEKIYEESKHQSNDVDTAQNNNNSEVSSLPWYLQVQAPERVVQPLSERQRIPELPESAPPILGPLLQQVSVDLGIDDLSLLDLRKLDPPPALGANLLMVIGTARSEKHLHVSADRLCRWLRSTYKLRPDADGLLGRNELKLKLRRKSRRAKLLGSAVDDNGDDGVRTGWVCVDIGVVEGPEGSTETTSTPKGFVGFGRQTDGVRLVVQMFTEEKREEMDLERLWGGILRRSIEAKTITSDSKVENVETLPTSTPTTDRPVESRLVNGPSSVFGQSRGFHTSARRLLVEAESRSTIEDLSPYAPCVSKPGYIDLLELQRLLALSEPGRSTAIRKFLQTSIPSSMEGTNQDWHLVVLNQLLSHLGSMSNADARAALGEGAKDLSSTPFLACFHQSLTSFPSKAEGDARMRFQCLAAELSHKGYTSEDILGEFRKLELFGTEISPDLYKRILYSVLQSTNMVRNGLPTHIELVKNAMYVLQAMHADGHDVLIEDILVELQMAMGYNPHHQMNFEWAFTNESTFDLSSIPISGLQRRLHALLMAVPLPCFTENSRIRLLKLYSRQHAWLEFWDIWRMAPNRGHSQSPKIYASMFNEVAKTNNVKGCMRVLRTWVPEMVAEEYAVSSRDHGQPIRYDEEVEKAIQACLRVAEPFVEQDAANTDVKGEWVDMWRRSTGIAKAQEEVIYRRINWDL